MAIRGRAACGAALVVAAVGLWAAGACGGQSLDGRYFRIGTGGVAGTYFPIGSLIAEGLTRPAANIECSQPEACGIPGLIAVAQTSNGSVANVRSVAAGELEAALVQANIATWAHRGEQAFAGETRLAGLRAVASLYPESLHVVVRRDLGIASIAELRGRRISLDEPGSGTLIDSRALLAAYALREGDLRAEYVKPGLAVTRMLDGHLDGFMVMVGYPAPSVVGLGGKMALDLVPIGRDAAEQIRAANPFFRASVIPAGTYEGIGETPTLEVNAQFVVNAALDERLVYAVTRALWGERMAGLLRQGHPKGRQISIATALEGLAIPLHPGAARYYREAGMLPAPAPDGRN